VTRLSPYLTHGLVTLPEVLAGVLRATRWTCSTNSSSSWAGASTSTMCGRTAATASCSRCTPARCPKAYAPRTARRHPPGRHRRAGHRRGGAQLYATGWLHNHARMWLASYVVHLRKRALARRCRLDATPTCWTATWPATT
jgi:deoxyribodipyrimidine photo-lyase